MASKESCDALFSQLIREQGRCAFLGCPDTATLQCAHVVGRGNLRLRWEPLNALCLCDRHHRWWHKEPARAMEWFASRFPERLSFLMAVRNEAAKPDYEEIAATLQQKLAEQREKKRWPRW